MRSTTLVKVTCTLIEQYLTTGAQAGRHVITKGLPDGSRLVGVRLNRLTEQVELTFVLPAGAEVRDVTAVAVQWIDDN